MKTGIAVQYDEMMLMVRAEVAEALGIHEGQNVGEETAMLAIRLNAEVFAMESKLRANASSASQED